MSTAHLNITLIQDNPVTGDVDGNAQKVLAHLENEQDADLVVFSECFLTGYPLNDLVMRPGFLALVDEHISEIRQAVIRMGGPSILLGAPQSGARLPYNAAFLIEPSGAVRVVRKCELPNADVFDERRTFAFANSEDAAPLMFQGFSLGVQICEDMWHGPVSRALADECAEVLLVINGSPYEGGKQAVRVKNAQRRVQTTGLPLIYVNQVGGQDELVFDGQSMTMNADGAIMTAAAFRPDIMRIVLRRDEAGAVHIEGRDETFISRDNTQVAHDEIAEDYAACVLGLRDYARKTSSQRVFIGISGGLDSALVMAMAVDALGAENVVGVMMPSRHTGEESLSLADDLMKRGGVHGYTIPITDSYDALNGVMTEMSDLISGDVGVAANHDIARENYQARLRGVTLMGLSNALGGIVLSTGNKSELAVGYSTLYGDMVGGFNPLKSVYKSEAFRMAAWRNGCDPKAFGFLGGADPIPEGIITRAPTAELAEGQTDQASLGDYEVLDTVLKSVIENGMGAVAATRHLTQTFSAEQLAGNTAGLSAQNYVVKIIQMIRGAQYKRVQSPPGVKLNTTDFGLGWRYPIAGKYVL